MSWILGTVCVVGIILLMIWCNGMAQRLDRHEEMLNERFGDPNE